MLASDDFDLPDWFIRQLILERPLAAPRLPPELLAPILNHALADQHPAARQKTRGRFRRVCKDWCESVDFWKEVDVVGSAKLHYLARHFVRSQAKKMATPDGPVEAPVRKPALEVKKLYLELDDVDEGGWSLLSLVSEVEELEILSIEGWYLDSNDGGAERTARVFAGLTKVKSFKVGGPSGNAGEWPVLGLSWVREVISHWPELESLALDGCEIHPSAEPPTTPLVDPSANPALRSIVARSFGTQEAVTEFLTGLPRTLTELVIDDVATYASANWTAPIDSHLRAVAPSLSSLALLDTPLDSTRHSTPRGVYDSLLPHLTSLNKLAISICAVSALNKLQVLPALSELELRAGYAEPATPLSCDEVLDYLGRQAGLRRLALPRTMLTECLPLELKELESAASKKGVEVEWVGQGLVASNGL